MSLFVQIARAKLAAIWLGPSGVAILTQLNSFVVFSEIVGGIGHSNGVVRDTSISHSNSDTKQLAEIHQTFFVAVCISSLTTLGVVFIAAEPISNWLFASNQHAQLVRIVAFAVPFIVLARFFHSILKGFRAVKALAIAVALGNLIGIIFFAILVYSANLVGAAIAILTTQIAIALAATVYATRNGAKLGFRTKFNFEIIRRNIGFSVAGIVAGCLASLAGMYVVRTVIASFGEDVGGIYSATWRISSLYMSVIFATTGSYFFPTVAKLATNQEVGKETSHTLRLFAAVLTPGVACLIIFANPIVQILLSSEFRDSARLMAYQMPGSVLRLVFELFALVVLARGFPGKFIACHATWFTLYLTLVTLAGSLFNSVESICVADALTYSILGVAAMFYFPRHMQWHLEKKAILTVIAASAILIGSTVIALLPISVLIKYLGGVALVTIWIGFWINDPTVRAWFIAKIQKSKPKNPSKPIAVRAGGPESVDILFVDDSLELGGVGILRLSVLAELAKQKINIRVVTLKDDGVLSDQVRALGIPVDNLGTTGGLFDVRSSWKLARYIKQHQPQIVQSALFLSNLHTRLACIRCPGPKHIIEEHGIYTWKKWHHQLIDRWINSGADGIIACSKEVARSASKNLGVPLSDIEIIHNCVAEHHLDKSELDLSDRDAYRTELTGFNQPIGKIVGIVGTLRWEKGHEFLVNAWQQLKNEGILNENDFLLIVGDGPLRPQLESQSNQAPSIRFLGSISDTRRLLKSLDLFILPSVNEGFGIAIIEAMAAGIPVIASKSGGIPEIMNSELEGKLVPPANTLELKQAITTLIAEESLMKEMGAAGQRAVFERFTPRIYVEKLNLLYLKLGCDLESQNATSG